MTSMPLPGDGVRRAVERMYEGDELYVQVAGRTRSLILPAVLRRCDLTGAALADGRLEIRFAPAGQGPGERAQ